MGKVKDKALELYQRMASQVEALPMFGDAQRTCDDLNALADKLKLPDIWVVSDRFHVHRIRGNK